MGGASTGGGNGGVGPAGMTATTVVAGKTKRNYGTKKDAKKTSNRFENYNNDNNGGGNDGNNTITQVTKTAPTEAEVSQSTTTEADADTEANRLLKVKKKGRSMTMMSGAKGVTKTSADYSLGKKSLLGRV